MQDSGKFTIFSDSCIKSPLPDVLGEQTIAHPRGHIVIIDVLNIWQLAELDDDPRLEVLSKYKWTGSFCKGHSRPSRGYYTDDGLYVCPSVSHRREYAYIKHQWREGGKVKSRSLQRAVLEALGRTLPVGKERIFFLDGDRLNFRAKNLVVRLRPPGGWLIDARRPENQKRPKFD
jgi:hypothetical protein